MIILITIGSIFFIIRRYENKIKYHKRFSEEINCENLNLETFSSNNFEFPLKNLKLKEQLGEGFFGVVYKAVARKIVLNEDETVVAVKTINKQAGNEILIASLSKELEIMERLGKHVNIVNSLGAVTSNVENIMLICEYCEHGNLQSFLQKHRPVFRNLIVDDKFDPFPTQNVEKSVGYVRLSSMNLPSSVYMNSLLYIDSVNLVSWSFQIARGMNYLSSKKILHGDLAARNILLCNGNVVKICDFGLAKSLYQNYAYKRNQETPLPYKWLALESIVDGVFSINSDIWSFGILSNYKTNSLY